jgi:hypothetical protein
VKGKLIRRNLKTQSLSAAKLRLVVFEKTGREKAQSVAGVEQEKMTIGDALAVCRWRLWGNPATKPRTKEY